MSHKSNLIFHCDRTSLRKFDTIIVYILYWIYYILYIILDTIIDATTPSSFNNMLVLSSSYHFSRSYVSLMINIRKYYLTYTPIFSWHKLFCLIKEIVRVGDDIKSWRKLKNVNTCHRQVTTWMLTKLQSKLQITFPSSCVYNYIPLCHLGGCWVRKTPPSVAFLCSAASQGTAPSRRPGLWLMLPGAAQWQLRRLAEGADGPRASDQTRAAAAATPHSQPPVPSATARTRAPLRYRLAQWGRRPLLRQLWWLWQSGWQRRQRRQARAMRRLERQSFPPAGPPHQRRVGPPHWATLDLAMAPMQESWVMVGLVM